MRNIKKQLITAFAGVWLVGCQTGLDPSFSALFEESKPVEPIPEALYLDAGVVRFLSVVSEEEIAEGAVFPQVRAAETLYFPEQLRQAMVGSGGWRHVWVIPETAVTDLRVEGTILVSNGQDLEIEIRARDATGKQWLKKTYEHEFTEAEHGESNLRRRATDGVFNQIAEDLIQARDQEGAQAMREIRSVAELRFAETFAPKAFERHLTQSGDRYRLTALPAEDDTVYQLVLQIKERDDLFIETMQQYSNQFSSSIDSAYRDWARQSFFERRAHDDVTSSALTQGLLSALAIVAGVAVAVDGGTPETRQLGQALVGAGAYGGYDAYKDYQTTEIHEAALKELGASLNIEVESRVVEVENRSHTLKGSVEEQYSQWHDILADVYWSERGTGH